MTTYYITVLRYYAFEAEDDTEALTKFENESAFTEMELDDESPAMELYKHNDNGEHITLWSE